MEINRQNYEEYFILYLDNELDADGRAAVENFASQHPDLEEELQMLGFARLQPDEQVVFENKSALLRTEQGSTIAEHEELLLLYTDNELDAAGRTKVEALASANESIRQELELLKQARFNPEHIEFPGKESLYRRSEAKVIRITGVKIIRIAAAAMVLLIAGAGIFYNVMPDSETGPVATVIPASTETDNSKVLPGETDEDITATVQLKEEGKKNTPELQQSSENNSRNFVAASNSAEVRKSAAKNEMTEEVKTNNLPEPQYTVARNEPEMENNPVRTRDMYKYTAPEAEIVKPSYAALGNVTNSLAQTPDITDDSDNGNNKLRGFFRKATRFVEKTTKINVTDEEDRLLIGGLTVKL